MQIAFWHVPAWANGGAAPNAWPLDAAGSRRLRLRGRAAAIRRCACSTTGTSRTRGCSPCPTPSRPTSRWRAPCTPPCTPPTRRRRSRPAISRATATRAAIRPPGPRGCAPTACRWISSAIHPYPLRRAPLAVRDPAHRIDLLDVPALARLAGVPVIVSEFGWSSDDAGARPAGGLDGAGDRARALHARPGRLRLLGLPRPSRAARRHGRSVGALRLAGRRRAAQARPQSAFDALRAPLDCAAVARRRARPQAGRRRARSRSPRCVGAQRADHDLSARG